MHSDDSYVSTLHYYCEKLLMWKDRNLKLPLDAIMRKTFAYKKSDSIKAVFSKYYHSSEPEEATEACPGH